MSDLGYCTVDDVRRALRSKDLPGDAAQDTQIVVDAITSQTEWLHETTSRHWYEPTGLDEDTQGIIPTEPRTHTEDEQDVPTRAYLTTEAERRSGSFFSPGHRPTSSDVGDGLQPREFGGDYTRVTLFRRDVQSLTELLVRNGDGGYDDWVSNTDFVEGRGEDYYLHTDDSDGLTRVYLNIDTLDVDNIENWSTAVVATYDWGIDGITRTVRRAVAMRAAAQLLTDDEAALGIPENASMVSAESKVQAMERQAEELLEVHL